LQWIVKSQNKEVHHNACHVTLSSLHVLELQTKHIRRRSYNLSIVIMHGLVLSKLSRLIAIGNVQDDGRDVFVLIRQRALSISSRLS